jgi:hypothetical protein
VRQDNSKVTVAYSWADAEGRRLEWGQILRMRDGLIIDMQDFARGSAGRRVAKLFQRGPE